jgi:hypothetical protein
MNRVESSLKGTLRIGTFKKGSRGCMNERQRTGRSVPVEARYGQRGIFYQCGIALMPLMGPRSVVRPGRGPVSALGEL